MGTEKLEHDGDNLTRRRRPRMSKASPGWASEEAWEPRRWTSPARRSGGCRSRLPPRLHNDHDSDVLRAVRPGRRLEQLLLGTCQFKTRRPHVISTYAVEGTKGCGILGRDFAVHSLQNFFEVPSDVICAEHQVFAHSLGEKNLKTNFNQVTGNVSHRFTNLPAFKKWSKWMKLLASMRDVLLISFKI